MAFISRSNRLALCVFAGLLAACSTPAPQQQQAQPQVAAQRAQERETTTGSRIPGKSNDRILRQIGQGGAREMDRERPPMPMSGGN